MSGAFISNELCQELEQVVGKEYVLSHPVDLCLYECDAETLDIAAPDIVVLPGSTSEVQRIMQVACKWKVPVTPRGAGTGLSGGATTVMGGISLVLTRLTKIISVSGSEMTARVEAGVTNSAVSLAAKKFNLYFAPDPSSQNASTIGGNIAENAGGAHTLKYGMTGSHVLAVKLVLPDGRIAELGGAFNDNLSVDLTGLVVGSEGTLGIVTEACLRLLPKSPATKTLLAYFPSLEDGGQAVSEIIAGGIVPCAMEMIDKLSLSCVEESLKLGLNTEAEALLIVELDGLLAQIEPQSLEVEKIVLRNSAYELKWAKDEKERLEIWKARKSAFGALGRIAPHAYVLDGVIPRSRLKEAISEIKKISKKYQLLVSNIYHAGDGNLHPSLLYNRDNEKEVQAVLLAAKEILNLCLALGGSLSGEHGIGIEKLEEMKVAFSPEDLDAMLKVRQCFNKDELCNPGKVIPTPKLCGESGFRPLLRYQLVIG